VYVAFELGKKEWKVAMTSGFGVAPWLRSVVSGDWRSVERAIAQGRARFGIPAAAPVVSCYEAGRDGFWIHRALGERGISNRVVDSASIEVNRRARRAKTDRLDALKLVMMLVRVCWGERQVWSEVHVPSVAAEAARQVSRVCSCVNAVRSRLTWRAASAATLGTCTSLHTRRSPPHTRTSIVTSFTASSRSVFARRARRLTSMLAESTTRLPRPRCRNAR